MTDGKMSRSASAPGGFLGEGKASMEQMDKAYNATHKSGPKFTIGVKQDMVIGGAIPSWVKQIPGPKYTYDTDKFKKRQPAWQMRPPSEQREKKQERSPVPASLEAMDKALEASAKSSPKYTIATKQEFVVGSGVPSWIKSIPGPKYTYDQDQFKKRQPVYTIGTKLDMVIGGGVPSWTKTIPAPGHYQYDTDKYKKRQPVYTIGEKLPSEADIMSTRSPGPIYQGSAIDVKKQAEVDSTKQASARPSFGHGPRWEGVAYRLCMNGSYGRYEHGKFAR
jgi:hypothetical protein